MRSQVKLCKIEGCNNSIWSKGVCKNHTLKTPMKMSKGLMQRIREAPTSKVDKVAERRWMFLLIWNKRSHKSEVSGDFLGKEPLTTFFHHILPKSKYPELDLIEENIMLMTPDEHNNVENDMYRYEEVNKRRDYLLKKYVL